MALRSASVDDNDRDHRVLEPSVAVMSVPWEHSWTVVVSTVRPARRVSTWACAHQAGLLEEPAALVKTVSWSAGWSEVSVTGSWSAVTVPSDTEIRRVPQVREEPSTAQLVVAGGRGTAHCSELPSGGRATTTSREPLVIRATVVPSTVASVWEESPSLRRRRW